MVYSLKRRSTSKLYCGLAILLLVLYCVVIYYGLNPKRAMTRLIVPEKHFSRSEMLNETAIYLNAITRSEIESGIVWAGDAPRIGEVFKHSLIQQRRMQIAVLSTSFSCVRSDLGCENSLCIFSDHIRNWLYHFFSTDVDVSLVNIENATQMMLAGCLSCFAPIHEADFVIVATDSDSIAENLIEEQYLIRTLSHIEKAILYVDFLKPSLYHELASKGLCHLRSRIPQLYNVGHFSISAALCSSWKDHPKTQLFAIPRRNTQNAAILDTEFVPSQRQHLIAAALVIHSFKSVINELIADMSTIKEDKKPKHRSIAWIGPREWISQPQCYLDLQSAKFQTNPMLVHSMDGFSRVEFRDCQGVQSGLTSISKYDFFTITIEIPESIPKSATNSFNQPRERLEVYLILRGGAAAAKPAMIAYTGSFSSPSSDAFHIEAQLAASRQVAVRLHGLSTPLQRARAGEASLITVQKLDNDRLDVMGYFVVREKI